MGTKRKHSSSYDHTRTKSKKTNTGTENTLGTLLAHRTDNQRASMSAIDLNVANLQEQVSSLPSALFHNYAVSQNIIDNIDLTLTSEPDGPYVISSDDEQDNGHNSNNKRSQDDEATEDRSSTLTAGNSFSENHLDNKSSTSVNIDTNKNSLQYTDDKLNTTCSQCSTAVTLRVTHLKNGHDYNKTTNNEEINNSCSKSTAYSYKTNSFGSNCVDITKANSNDGAQATNNIGTTKNTVTLQSNDDEMNVVASEWFTASTLVGQLDNGNKYCQTKNYEEIKDTRSKSSMETPRGSTIITSIREQENGCFIYMTEYDEAMNEISSNVYSIEKQKTPISKKPFVIMS